ncbi:hypothetical protein [Flaviaesturariibacter amylovorans]|uniref:DUF4303 domain-containing protein n=1 Tax=Flaviaesturariibacter amylovorans TaxID=1084520 RepID=A0ABP8GLC5_9BACT
MSPDPAPYWLPESERAHLSPDSISNLEGILQRALEGGTYLQFDTSEYSLDEARLLLLTIVGVAQYRKEWVGHLATHKLHLQFRDEDGTELPPSGWPYADGIQEWFDDFRASCPIGFLLLGQEEALQLAVAGDIINSIPDEEAKHEGDHTTYYFSAMEAKAMEERVFLQCLYFLEYCAPTGTDATPHIDALIDTLGCSFSSADVRAQWETHRADLRVSIRLSESA